MLCVHVCVHALHLPHPSNRGAQPGSHFAAPLWPSHPHQPCVILPNPVGEVAGTPLWTQRHIFCLLSLSQVQLKT